jgi:hypothetical protein
MTENSGGQHIERQQPRRPPMRGAWKYDILRELSIQHCKPAPAPEPQYEELFKVTFIATKEKGVSMDDGKNFLIDLIFEPNEGKLRLRPQETQLLLAHYAELLQEITDEEQVIIEEEKTASNQNPMEKY